MSSSVCSTRSSVRIREAKKRREMSNNIDIPVWVLRYIDDLVPYDYRRCNMVCRNWRGHFRMKFSAEVVEWLYRWILYSSFSSYKYRILPRADSKYLLGTGDVMKKNYLNYDFGVGGKDPYLSNTKDRVYLKFFINEIGYGIDRKLAYMNDMINDVKKYLKDLEDKRERDIVSAKIPIDLMSIDPFIMFEFIAGFHNTVKTMPGRSILLHLYLQRNHSFHQSKSKYLHDFDSAVSH